MKVLLLNGSPRKNGNTAQFLKRDMDGAREAGAEVELVNLYDLQPILQMIIKHYYSPKI